MRASRLVQSVLTVAISCVSANAQQKRVYIAADDHTDFWRSGTESDYRQAFAETLDFHLDLIDATSGNPPEHQNRWNCDGHLWMWVYEQERSPAQFQRLIAHQNQSVAARYFSPATNRLSLRGGLHEPRVRRGSSFAARTASIRVSMFETCRMKGGARAP